MEVCPSLGGLLDGPPCTLGTVCPECGFVGTSQVQSQLPTSAFNATGTLPVLGVSTTCRREATFLQVTAGLGSDSELTSFVSYHHPQRWICTISDICIIPRAASFAPKVSSASSWWTFPSKCSSNLSPWWSILQVPSEQILPSSVFRCIFCTSAAVHFGSEPSLLFSTWLPPQANRLVNVSACLIVEWILHSHWPLQKGVA